jgi:hypothetical protein
MYWIFFATCMRFSFPFKLFSSEININSISPFTVCCQHLNTRQESWLSYVLQSSDVFFYFWNFFVKSAVGKQANYIFVVQETTDPSNGAGQCRSLSGTAGSVSAGGENLCIVWDLCVVPRRGLCDGPISRPGGPCRVWMCHFCDDMQH